MVVVVYAAVEFFDVVDHILGHFEMNFPSFEETLRMKHHTMDDDKALWTRYARLLHLQTQFKAGWDEELCFNGRSNLFQATHKKLDEIASWNLKTVDDAKAIVGEAEAHVKELKETVVRDVQGIRRMPDDAEANARQVLEKNAHLSFLLDVWCLRTGHRRRQHDVIGRGRDRMARVITGSETGGPICESFWHTTGPIWRADRALGSCL